jgi:hypothetical protein
VADALADLQLDNPAARERHAAYLAAAEAAGLVPEQPEGAAAAAAAAAPSAQPASPQSVTSYKMSCLSALHEYLHSADVEEVGGAGRAGARLVPPLP